MKKVPTPETETGKPSAERASRYGFTPEQLDVIEQDLAVFEKPEREKFLATCQATKLSPLLRQIYATARWDKDKGVNRCVATTGIDGLRKVAVETGEYEGQTPPMWCNKDGIWRDVWLDENTIPYAAKVGVWRKGFHEALVGVARYASFVQTVSFKRGDRVESTPTAFWKKAPDNQLLKCAEAQALRKAFPQCDGLYLREEIHDEGADTVPPADTSPVEQPKAPETVPTVEKPTRKKKADRPPGYVEAEQSEIPGTKPEDLKKSPPAPPLEPAAATPEPPDPLFEERVELPKEFDHVIGCLSTPAFKGRKLQDLSVLEVGTVYDKWVIGMADSIARNDIKKEEARCVTVAYQWHKAHPKP